MNILKNSINDDGLDAIEAVLKDSQALKSICGTTGTELNISAQGSSADDGVDAAAIELRFNRALEKLVMSAQGRGAKAGKTLGGAIATNTALRELGLLGGADVNFAKAFSVGLGTNTTLEKLSFSGPKHQSVVVETSMNSVDFGAMKLDASGAAMVVAFLSKCRYANGKRLMIRYIFANRVWLQGVDGLGYQQQQAHGRKCQARC